MMFVIPTWTVSFVGTSLPPVPPVDMELIVSEPDLESVVRTLINSGVASIGLKKNDDPWTDHPVLSE